MQDLVAIKRALISVSDKAGLKELAEALAAAGVEILSTGGTAKFLRDAKIKIRDVADVTKMPEMMDGRVKTLHPAIHGGLLARRDLDAHQADMKQHGIEAIDLLIVNLYPFTQTVAGGGDYAECVENIDIGGPAMIRAAAKNHEFVTVVTSPHDYATLLMELKEQGAKTSLGFRKKMAQAAYAHTSSYDAAISSWMAKQLGDEFPETFTFSGARKQVLRYGENPQQRAALYVTDNRPGLACAEQVQGKELSYNNINDADAALELVAEFSEPAVAIIKHANPCGVAEGKNLAEAYKRAYACDTVSAFGGVIALNRPLDAATAEAITSIFTEVVIAPGADENARKIFAKKQNLRLLILPQMPDPQHAAQVVRAVQGGFLAQSRDNTQVQLDDLKVVTDKKPSAEQLQDLLFAFRVCKHVKSNAIVYAKNGATIGIGAGQMSRVDSARIAKIKAGEMGLDLADSVAASDAFFPFPDGLLTIADAGATAVIQPGGSMRDDEVIKAANERGIAMVLTGVRHFKH